MSKFRRNRDFSYDKRREGATMRSVLFYIAIYFGVFLVMHFIGGFRRWWYGAVGAIGAVILSLAPQLLALGIWPMVLAALLVVGLNLAILRDLRIL